MKLVTFLNPASLQSSPGVLLEEQGRILDLQHAQSRVWGAQSNMFVSMLSLIEAGHKALDAAVTLVQKHEPSDYAALGARLLSPLPTPPQIRDCLCFEQHLINTVNTANKIGGVTEYTPRQHRMFELMYKRPFWYKCNRFAVTGPDTTVVWPPYSSLMDYELEMGVVLGRRGRDISAGEARSHIFGYTIFNDLSARDVQGAEMDMFGPCKSKDFDSSNVLGPCIVTADEFDPYSADMTSRINGIEQNVGNSSSMHFKFEDLITFISEHETLMPGEIIGSGTVGGGSGLDLGRFLESGDLIELEIKGIGVLRNKVLSYQDRAQASGATSTESAN